MLNNSWFPESEELRFLKEVTVATIAAAVGAYVRAKRHPRPLSWPSVGVGLAEATVCGFLAVGASGLMDWEDSRSATGLAAAMGLLGTKFVSDGLIKMFSRYSGDESRNSMQRINDNAPRP